MATYSKRFLALTVGVMCLSTVTAAADPPSILSVRPNSTTVALYEKFELRIDLKATYADPLDPDEVDLRAELTAPSGKKWNIWGFYNPSGWACLWMARFAPTEKGTWRYMVTVTDSQGTAKSGEKRRNGGKACLHVPVGRQETQLKISTA